MSRTPPDHRFQEIVLRIKEGRDGSMSDPSELAIRLLIKTDRCSDPILQYMWELHADEEHRSVVDAFMLAFLERRVIHETLGIAEPVLEKYAYYFMDTDVFRNKLELMSYARNYESNAYGKELVRTAVTVGPEYLLWAYGTGTQLDTRYVIRKTMVDAFFRGLAHRGNALTSGVAKEAQKWWVTAVKNAELLERVDPHTEKAAAEELRIAIEGRDETLKPEQAPVPLDQILH